MAEVNTRNQEFCAFSKRPGSCSTAITFNLVALSIGISAYISLSYSDCREDPTFFAFWWRVWRFVIFAGYVVFAAGLHAFFSQNHSFVDAVYPHYANPPVYNTTIGEIEESKGWHLQSEANKLADTSKTCFWVVYSVGFAIHLTHSVGFAIHPTQSG